MTTALVVPDATRPFEPGSIRACLQDLIASDEPLLVIVALGLHRPMTDRELQPLRDALQGLSYVVHQHDPFGPCRDGLNERLFECDRIICVGTVEPHQYAGFSGGAKALSIGCGSAEQIGGFHGLTYLRDPACAIGRIAGNPFRAAVDGGIVALRDRQFVGIQLVPATGSWEEELVVGPLQEAFQGACEIASERFFRRYESYLDWVHLRVPEEKGSNFYQASRGATYAALAHGTALRPGGAIILEAPCPEGLGQGAGEEACAEAMRLGRDELLRRLHDPTAPALRGGEQRAYVLARACARNRIVLVGAPPIEELAALGIEQFDMLRDARRELEVDLVRGERIDDIFHGIPVRV